MTIIKFRCLHCDHRHDLRFKDEEDIKKPLCPKHNKEMMMQEARFGDLQRIKEFLVPVDALKEPEVH